MDKLPHGGEQLRPLTSLRFFAAVAILIAHTYPRKLNEADGFVQLGTGVTFFFILSGFILTHTYLKKLSQPTIREIWNFYVARAARIWPVHVLTVAVILPLFFTDLWSGKHGDPIINLSSTLALLQTFFLEGQNRVLNPPSWSLAAEVFFYLCFPFLIWGVASRGVFRRVGVLLLALTPWLLALVHQGHIAFVSATFARFNFYFFPPVRLSDFVAGVVLGYVWHHRQRVGIDPLQRTVRSATLIEMCAVLFLVAWACLWVRLAPTLGESYNVNWCGVYMPPFLVAIWVFANGHGLLSKLLSTRPLTYLGELSFSIYMIHVPVMNYLNYTAIGQKIAIWGWKMMGWAGGPLVIVSATITLSSICYHCCEMPLRGWIRKKLSIRKSTAPAVEPTVLAFDSANRDRIVRLAA